MQRGAAIAAGKVGVCGQGQAKGGDGYQAVKMIFTSYWPHVTVQVSKKDSCQAFQAAASFPALIRPPTCPRR